MSKFKHTFGLRALFLKYLIQDSKTQDARRKEYNQAIFDGEEGWAVFNGTDLDMVLGKFDKAVKEWKGVELNSDELAGGGIGRRK